VNLDEPGANFPIEENHWGGARTTDNDPWRIQRYLTARDLDESFSRRLGQSLISEDGPQQEDVREPQPSNCTLCINWNLKLNEDGRGVKGSS
jgi:hypothetical protein